MKRTGLLLSVFATFLLAVGPALAVTPNQMRSVVERTWYGASVQNASFTRSGKAYVLHRYELRFQGDRRFTGTSYTTFKLDGVNYRASWTVSGTVDAARHTVQIQSGRQLSGDRLPRGLQWCGGRGTLTVYRDRDNAGEFILSGTVHTTCGDSMKLELGSKRRP